jgi:pilus assembly protein Flp/PilA
VICLPIDMNQSMSKLQRFNFDQSGATAIEYALIAGSISIVIVAAVNSIGSNLNSTFIKVSNGFH